MFARPDGAPIEGATLTRVAGQGCLGEQGGQGRDGQADQRQVLPSADAWAFPGFSSRGAGWPLISSSGSGCLAHHLLIRRSTEKKPLAGGRVDFEYAYFLIHATITAPSATCNNTTGGPSIRPAPPSATTADAAIPFPPASVHGASNPNRTSHITKI